MINIKLLKYVGGIWNQKATWEWDLLEGLMTMKVDAFYDFFMPMACLILG